MKAGRACQGFICNTAKNREDTMIAVAGVVFWSSPLRMRPLQSHSSKRGANTDTEINVIHTGASIICSIALSNHSGVGGMIPLRLSPTNPVARVATDTIRAILNPPSCPKLLLSRAYPVSKNSFLLLVAEAYSIAGMNITGYEMTVP